MINIYRLIQYIYSLLSILTIIQTKEIHTFVYKNNSTTITTTSTPTLTTNLSSTIPDEEESSIFKINNNAKITTAGSNSQMDTTKRIYLNDFNYDENYNDDDYNHIESRKLNEYQTKNITNKRKPSAMRNAVQAAALEGLNSMIDLYDNIEPELIKKGFFLDKNHPATKLFEFSAPIANNSDQNAKAAYASLVAAKKLQNSFKFNFSAHSRQVPRKISLRKTPLEGLCPPREPPKCPPASRRYRTHDGTCNNFRKPRWGSAQMPFHRFLAPEYADGLESMRISITGNSLASARFISLLVHGSQESESPVTLMLAQWGQFIDHDLTSTAQPRSVNGSIPRCCGVSELHPACATIKVPKDDPWLAPLNVRCLEFLRSAPAQRRDCALSWREQTNQVTSFIDASPIYSSNAQTADNARVFHKGLLLFGRGAPQDDVCMRGALSNQCVRSGDSRSGEQPGLLAMHHVMVGEHNRIALDLNEINPHWSDEKIYQETRRIIGAMFQHITYREFLPLILGRDVCRLFDLELQNEGFYTQYDPRINPSVANSFAASAFRFGHSLIQGSYMRSNHNHQFIDNNVTLHEENAKGDIGSSGSLHRLLRGLAMQRAQKRDEFITSELTNHLFQSGSFPFGLDLAAINIQRGRDHGLPAYTQWREPCGLSPIRDWFDLERIVGKRSVQRIQQGYRDVHDVDLFVAGLAERPVVGGLVGPTFACIIAQQFSNLRKGDRFWYENDNFESSFTPAQLQSIRHVSLAQILCRTLGGGTLQPHVFLPHDIASNERRVCGFGSLAPIDLLPWIEKDPFFHKDTNNIQASSKTDEQIQILQDIRPFDASPTIFDKVEFSSNGNTGLQRPITHQNVINRTPIHSKLDFRNEPIVLDNKVDIRKTEPTPRTSTTTINSTKKTTTKRKTRDIKDDADKAATKTFNFFDDDPPNYQNDGPVTVATTIMNTNKVKGRPIIIVKPDDNYEIQINIRPNKNKLTTISPQNDDFYTTQGYNPTFDTYTTRPQPYDQDYYRPQNDVRPQYGPVTDRPTQVYRPFETTVRPQYGSNTQYDYNDRPGYRPPRPPSQYDVTEQQQYDYDKPRPSYRPPNDINIRPQYDYNGRPEYYETTKRPYDYQTNTRPTSYRPEYYDQNRPSRPAQSEYFGSTEYSSNNAYHTRPNYDTYGPNRHTTTPKPLLYLDDFNFNPTTSSNQYSTPYSYNEHYKGTKTKEDDEYTHSRPNIFYIDNKLDKTTPSPNIRHSLYTLVPLRRQTVYVINTQAAVAPSSILLTSKNATTTLQEFYPSTVFNKIVSSVSDYFTISNKTLKTNENSRQEDILNVDVPLVEQKSLVKGTLLSTDYDATTIDDYNDDDNETITFDKDGYLRPEHMHFEEQLLVEHTTVQNILTDQIEIDDFVVPSLTKLQTNLTTGKHTFENDIKFRHSLDKDIFAEDFLTNLEDDNMTRPDTNDKETQRLTRPSLQNDITGYLEQRQTVKDMLDGDNAKNTETNLKYDEMTRQDTNDKKTPQVTIPHSDTKDLELKQTLNDVLDNTNYETLLEKDTITRQEAINKQILQVRQTVNDIVAENSAKNTETNLEDDEFTRQGTSDKKTIQATRLTLEKGTTDIESRQIVNDMLSKDNTETNLKDDKIIRQYTIDKQTEVIQLTLLKETMDIEQLLNDILTKDKTTNSETNLNADTQDKHTIQVTQPRLQNDNTDLELRQTVNEKLAGTNDKQALQVSRPTLQNDKTTLILQQTKTVNEKLAKDNTKNTETNLNADTSDKQTQQLTQPQNDTTDSEQRQTANEKLLKDNTKNTETNLNADTSDKQTQQLTQPQNDTTDSEQRQTANEKLLKDDTKNTETNLNADTSDKQTLQLTRPQNDTPDSEPRQTVNEILAEDDTKHTKTITSEKAQQQQTTIIRNTTKTADTILMDKLILELLAHHNSLPLSMVPLNVLTKPERPDNWLMYEATAKKVPLPNVPMVVMNENSASEFPRPFLRTRHGHPSFNKRKNIHRNSSSN